MGVVGEDEEDVVEALLRIELSVCDPPPEDDGEIRGEDVVTGGSEGVEEVSLIIMLMVELTTPGPPITAPDVVSIVLAKELPTSISPAVLLYSVNRKKFPLVFIICLFIG